MVGDTGEKSEIKKRSKLDRYRNDLRINSDDQRMVCFSHVLLVTQRGGLDVGTSE